MSLFNTKKETNKQPINEIQKAKGRRAKTAQQTIPYEEVYPNGIIQYDGMFERYMESNC